MTESMIKYYVVFSFKDIDGSMNTSGCVISRKHEISGMEGIDWIVEKLKQLFGYELVLVTNIIRLPI